MSTSIPQPPGVPLLGNIFDVDPNDTWGSLKELANNHGPIFKINALGTQVVFIGSASLLEEICDEKRFRKCVTGPIIEIRQAVHDSLFTAFHHEQSWGIAHRIMAPWVSPSANKAIFNDMRDSVADIVSKWSASPTQRVDVSDDLKRVSFSSATFCFFRQRINSLEGPEPPMIAAMDHSTMEAVKRPTRPKLLNWLFYQRAFSKDITTMRLFAADIVAKRQSDEASHEDILHALLHSQDPETGERLGEQQVIDEIITLYIGNATTPCLISFVLYYLLKNPREITTAREEIDSVLGTDGQLTSSDLSKFQYCEAILRESMRLSAVAPGFNIEPIPDQPGEVTLAGGKYVIPRDQVMIAILDHVNRDPEVFSDPEAFRPKRMLGDAYEKLPSGVKKGFGNGNRQCFGKQYAWQWSMITLITILRNIDLEMANPNYELKQNGAFCVQPLQFYALVGPRK